MNERADYFFGPDHQISKDQLLPATITAQERIDNASDQVLFDTWERLDESLKRDNSGIPYAVISDDRGASTTDCVVVQAPYANRLVPVGGAEDIRTLIANPEDEAARSAVNKTSWNMLTKHYFLHEVLKEAGVRDQNGDTIPVLIVSSPSGDHSRTYDRSKKRQIQSGDFEPMGFDITRIARGEGFGRIFAAGYSLGAVAAANAANVASLSHLDVSGVSLAELPMRRGMVATARAFMNFGPRSYSEDERATTDEEKVGGWTDKSPRLIRDMHKANGGWIGNIFAAKGNNVAILRGLGNNERVIECLDALAMQASHIRNDFAVSFIYSKHSRLSKGVEDYLRGSRWIERLAQNGLFNVLVADGHNTIDDQHGFGENHQYYADAMARAALFAFSPKS